MMLTIQGLPTSTSYQELKRLIKQKCNITDFILDSLVMDDDGCKKVRIGVTDDGEGNLLMKYLNGFHYSGHVIRVVPVGKPNQQNQGNFEGRGGYQQRNEYSNTNFGNRALSHNTQVPHSNSWVANAQWAGQGAGGQMPQHTFPNQPIQSAINNNFTHQARGIGSSGISQHGQSFGYGAKGNALDAAITTSRDNFQGSGQFHQQSVVQGHIQGQSHVQTTSWSAQVQPAKSQVFDKQTTGGYNQGGFDESRSMTKPGMGNDGGYKDYDKGDRRFAPQSRDMSPGRRPSRMSPESMGGRMSPSGHQSRRMSPTGHQSRRESPPPSGPSGRRMSPGSHGRRVSPTRMGGPASAGRGVSPTSGRRMSPSRQGMPAHGRKLSPSALGRRMSPSSFRRVSPPGPQGRRMSPTRPQGHRISSPEPRGQRDSPHGVPGRRMSPSSRRISPGRRETSPGRGLSPTDRRRVSPGRQSPGLHGSSSRRMSPKRRSPGRRSVSPRRRSPLLEAPAGIRGYNETDEAMGEDKEFVEGDFEEWNFDECDKIDQESNKNVDEVCDMGIDQGTNMTIVEDREGGIDEEIDLTADDDEDCDSDIDQDTNLTVDKNCHEQGAQDAQAAPKTTPLAAGILSYKKAQRANNSKADLAFNLPEVREVLRHTSRAGRKRYRLLIADKVPWYVAIEMCQKRWSQLPPDAHPKRRARRARELARASGQIPYNAEKKKNFKQAPKHSPIVIQNNTGIVKNPPAIPNVPEKKNYFSQGIKYSEVCIKNTDTSTAMTKKQSDLLCQSIIGKIMQMPKSEGPRFEDYAYKCGTLHVNCRDKQSQKWLQQEVSNLQPWPEAKLTATLTLPQFHKPTILSALVPASESLNAAQAFSLFKIQNRGLNTEDWMLLSTESQPEGLLLKISVDQRSEKIIREANFKVCLGFKTIHFKREGS